MKCKWCGKNINNSIRFGACFMCVEIESIVIDGEDMNTPFTKNGYISCYDKKDKLNLIKKHFPRENAEYWYSFHTKRARKMKLNKINQKST